MKKLLLPIVVLTSLFVISCQKEVNNIFANTSGGGNSLGLLTKVVTKNGSDSSVISYSYNNSNKITGVNNASVTSGNTTVSNDVIVRNNQGIIQEIITKSTDFTSIAIDSVISIINYDASSKHYTNRIVKYSTLGVSFLDSAAFIYDAFDKIITEFDYIDDGSGNKQTIQSDFTYSGSNMSGLKLYNLSSGTPILQTTELFDYDAKPSPLTLGNEAFIVNNAFQFLSVNNILKQTVSVAGDRVTHLVNYNYTYNLLNQPVTASLTQDGQSAGTINYYYK